jgi:hypothetical protein
VELPEGYLAEPDDSGWVVRRIGGRWKNLMGEQWGIGRDRFEVRRWIAGVRRRHRYTGAVLALEFAPSGHPDNRCLVLYTRGEQRVLATGERADLRRLADWLSQQTGWRLRVAKHRPAPEHRRGTFPLGLAFLLGGLLVVGIGIGQYRGAAREMRKLIRLRGSGLQSVAFGTPVLATGTVSGEFDKSESGLALYRVAWERIRPKEGAALHVDDSHRPDFWLHQREGLIPVVGGRYQLVKPPHVQQQGAWRYEGFRPGDTATAIGTVVSTPAGRALDAEKVFGGTAEQLPGFVQREGLITIAAGLLSLGIGVFLISLVRRH